MYPVFWSGSCVKEQGSKCNLLTQASMHSSKYTKCTCHPQRRATANPSSRQLVPGQERRHISAVSHLDTGVDPRSTRNVRCSHSCYIVPKGTTFWKWVTVKGQRLSLAVKVIGACSSSQCPTWTIIQRAPRTGETLRLQIP